MRVLEDIGRNEARRRKKFVPQIFFDLVPHYIACMQCGLHFILVGVFLSSETTTTPTFMRSFIPFPVLRWDYLPFAVEPCISCHFPSRLSRPSRLSNA